MNTFAVCVVSYNTHDLLRACLDSVLANPLAAAGDSLSDSVIVVDNGSTDGTLEMIRSDYSHVQLFTNTRNAGYGAAANQAFAQCQADYVLLLNSDTRLMPDGLVQLRAFLDQHADVAIVGPRLLNPDGTLQPSCFHFPTPLEVFLDVANARKLIGHLPRLRDVYLRTWDHAHPRQVAWVSGAALAIRRSAFEMVHGFDPSFFFYYEETDLCFRLHQTGWKVFFAPVTDVVHVGGASSRSQQTQLTVQLYASLAHFYRQHYTLVARVALALLLQAVALLRWLRDGWQLQRTTNSAKRASLQANVAAWRLMLRGQWMKQVP